MSKKFWTEEKDAWLRRDYPDRHLGSLAARMGTTVAGLKTRARVLGLHRIVQPHSPWTQQQIDYLIANYANTSLKVLIAHTGHGQHSIYNKALDLGLRKSQAYRSEMGRQVSAHPNSQKTRYAKGHEPYNKGKRECEFRSKEASERCATTQFKKGCQPHNARPVGYEHFRKQNDKGYIFIKVKEGEKMVMKHRWLWEQAYGPIPDDCNVVFRDGNSCNCVLSNLELVSRKEHCRRQITSETPDERKARCEKAYNSRMQTIRRDRARIHFGLAPKTKLIKRW